jgi:heterodisulfide reductase subunit D
MAYPSTISDNDLLSAVTGLRGGERVIACYQCGTCSGSCPTAPAMDYTPRRILHMLRLGLGDRVLRSRAIWLCTTCYSCTARCPREIRITDAMISLRRLAVGCVASFYPTVYGIPQAMVQVMGRAGIEVAALGGEEWCCGYPLFTAGMEGLVAELMAHNVARVREMGAKTLVTTCPSCHYTWSHLYPQLDPSPLGFEVLHSSQFLARLIVKGRLKPGSFEQVVTYHDPCDLGRKSGVFDAPRQVIEAVPGIELREMVASRENALCCGGGGDVQIVDESVTASVAARRLGQAQQTGARVILSACQQCKRTLMAAARREKARVRVMDVAELVWQAME